MSMQIIISADILAAVDPPDDASPAQVPETFQVLPLGEIRLLDGPVFTLDPDAVASIVARFNQRGLDMVVDYEHQTEGGKWRSPDGTAPAAGWIKALEDRGPDGLWAVVEWTERARRYLQNREYRYFSPVFMTSKDGRVLELLRVALTNAPRIENIRPIVAGSAHREDDAMELVKQLAKALELPEDASAQDVLDAVDRIKQSASQEPAEVVACREVLEALDLREDAGKSEVVASILALKQKPDLSREVADLKKRLAERERDDLVLAALKDGKITPAQKEWAERYALEDPEGFRIFLAKAPQVVPTDDLAGLQPGRPTGERTDDLQIQINKMLGISDEVWAKYNPEPKS